jgi:hypothetical protein
MRRKRLDAPENPSDLGTILRLCCNLSTLSIASMKEELDVYVLTSVARKFSDTSSPASYFAES